MKTYTACLRCSDLPAVFRVNISAGSQQCLTQITLAVADGPKQRGSLAETEEELGLESKSIRAESNMRAEQPVVFGLDVSLGRHKNPAQLCICAHRRPYQRAVVAAEGGRDTP